MRVPDTPIHLDVLNAARRLCRRRGAWTFRPDEIVRALPHLNAASVRTHIVSRCCVNAPRHHAHAWDYFRRVARGVYEVRPKHRKAPAAAVAEARVAFHAPRRPLRDTVHAVVVRDGAWYTAECLEIAVVTQGRTLDETAEALREAVALHLGDGDADVLGLVASPRLVIQYESSVGGGVATA